MPGTPRGPTPTPAPASSLKKLCGSTGQAIEIVGIEKKVMVGRTMRSAYWLNHDPSGLADAGYGPATK